MVLTLRSIIVTSVPALAALLGFLWFLKKKKDDDIDNAIPTVRPKEEKVSKDSVSTSDDKLLPAAASALEHENIPLCPQVLASISNPNLGGASVVATRDKPPDKQRIHETVESDVIEKSLISESNASILEGSRTGSTSKCESAGELSNKSETSNNNQQDSTTKAASLIVPTTAFAASSLPEKDVLENNLEKKENENKPVLVGEHGQGDGSPTALNVSDDILEKVISQENQPSREDLRKEQRNNVSLQEVEEQLVQVSSISQVESLPPQSSSKPSSLLKESTQDVTFVNEGDANEESVVEEEEQQCVVAAAAESERDLLTAPAVAPVTIEREVDQSDSSNQNQNILSLGDQNGCEAKPLNANNVCDNGNQDPSFKDHVKVQQISDTIKNVSDNCNDIVRAEAGDRDGVNLVSTDDDAAEDRLLEEEVSNVTNGSMSASPSLGPSSVGSPVETAVVNGSHSDVQSEHSADSGNGSSIVDSGAASLTHGCDPSQLQKVEYCFDFPADICGMLIGRKGNNIKEVKERSGCEITVRDKMYTPEYKLIVLEGTQRSVEKCIEIIKKRFPPHKFGPIDFAPAAPENPILVPEIMQLSLPDGVYVDVNVSSVVTANHLFLQQPTHPSFYMLEKQNSCMLMCYAQDGIVPQLPRPIEVGMICAAPMFNGWYRSQIVTTYEDTDESDIKYVDYGGYAKVHNCAMRQIRSDFTALPFQAVECYLANVVPPKDELVFPPEANAVLEEMVHHQLLQAEVVAYEDDGVPYVNLYKTLPDSSLYFINRELVNRGVARWMEQSL